MSTEFESILQDYFHRENVDEMEFERINDKLCRITAHLKGGNTFTYTDDIHWGVTLSDFYDTLDRFTNGVSYTFNNFDPQDEIDHYQENSSNFYGDY